MRKDDLNTLDSLSDEYEAEFTRLAKRHLRRYVKSVAEPAARFGPDAYICPCCGSGTGKNNQYTPAFFLFQAADGTPLFKCHSCDATGNIFTLAGIVNGTENFQECRRIVADFLGVDLAKRTPLSEVPAPDAKEGSAEPRSQRETLQLRQQANAYIADCRKHIGETDYFHLRGLTDETIERFRLGYDPKRRMAVIPFTSSYYMGRYVGVGADERGASKHYKPSGLRQPVFNLAALSESRDPVFLTEAPLDAISLMQSGGSAMALGGTAVSVLKTVLDVYRPKNPFILAFDEDGPGRRLQERVTSLLEERGIPYSVAEHPAFAAHKDANAALMADPDELRSAVTAEIERARALAHEFDQQQPAPKLELEDAALAASTAAAAKRAVSLMERPVRNSRPKGR